MKPRYDRLVAEGRCPNCTASMPAESVHRICPVCRAKARVKALVRYRTERGLPIEEGLAARAMATGGMGANRWRDPPHQCRRCTEPHAPGSELCSDHLQILAELADDRAAGRNVDLFEEEA